MAVTKAKLREFDIVNQHNLASCDGGLHVWVGYSPADTGRAYRSAKWQVCRVGFKTDASASAWWGDNGNKTFNVYRREEKESQRLAAIEWATKRYGIEEWEKSPFGSYHPKGTLAKVTKK